MPRPRWPGRRFLVRLFFLTFLAPAGGQGRPCLLGPKRKLGPPEPAGNQIVGKVYCDEENTFM
ncbi:hypothetical protein ACFWOG_10665 [Kitasatospora sp. NPDC058406]|uniref:hypothetical protein n=1 Tax=Kitasatospora sp. NPDC058406 TaxID=3346483 RepID=UPI00366088AB